LSTTRLALVSVALATSLCACGGASNIPPAAQAGPPIENSAPVQSTPQPQITTAASTETSAATLHMPTWAFDEYGGPGASASSADVQKYVSYAEGGLGNTKALTDCSGSGKCSSVFYVDPNFLYDDRSCVSQEATDVLDVSEETWYVHQSGYRDADHRVHGEYTMSCNGESVTMPVDVLNDSNADVQAFFRDYLRDNGNDWNYYFMDDTSGEELTQFYGPGGGFCPNEPDHYCTTTEELPTNQSIVGEHEDFVNAMTHTNGSAMSFFYNGLTFSDETPSDLDVLESSKNFVGVVCEGCVVSGGTFNARMYPEVLNAMAQIDKISGAAFVELSLGASGSGSAAQIAQRVVTTAVAWLGYSAGHTIVFPDLEDNTTYLAAWPEENIVPADPVESMSTSSVNIEVTDGVFRREFASCTNAGTAIGPCAAFVNSTGSAVKVLSSWLHETYGHVIEPYGGDVTHGGEVLLTSEKFTPNETTIPADQALLISR
jgi:hypothetical protein